jgi:pyruvate kinase
MTKIIVTLGPSTNTIDKIALIKSKGVDFVRINMSHSTIKDLEYYINLAKQVDVPFIIDTEGSQIRTGVLSDENIFFKENDKIKIYVEEILGDSTKVNIRPWQIVKQLCLGDILYVDFDTLVMRVSDVSTINRGYIEATIISSGQLGNNKGVVVDPRIEKKFELPTLSQKDIEAIQLGIREDIKYVAASFMRSEKAVKEVRKISEHKMQVISKVECQDALDNLNEIIDESDYILIDRGDLSKEIPIEKIPFTQKIILQRAKKSSTPVFVATNLLESMISNRKPTRAEVHDIINTIVDGAYGLTLAAETAIGKYPIGCINMLNKVISHSNLIINAEEIRSKEEKFVRNLESKNYLDDHSIGASIIEPHGGVLVNREIDAASLKKDFDLLQRVTLNENQINDFEQISIGTYSPLEGFMNKAELTSVLDNLRLPSGIIWPIPILLDITSDTAQHIDDGDSVLLQNSNGTIVGSMDQVEKFTYDKETLCNKFYGHVDQSHPGVRYIYSLNPVFLGGTVRLCNYGFTDCDQYKITPKQTRRVFEEKNWSKVVGFHTRNAIHLAHEYIQMESLKKGSCDGLFVHPVIGKKKKGDYNAKFIIDSYKIMLDNFYPDNKVVFGVFSTYSRYGGAKEALFTALCRKNYGCSHFIIGRDHTGVGSSGNHYNPTDIISKFSDLGIEIIQFDTVYYSNEEKRYIEHDTNKSHIEEDRMDISGTEAREMLMNGQSPPKWFMRPEISNMLVNAILNGEEVFVK